MNLRLLVTVVVVAVVVAVDGRPSSCDEVARIEWKPKDDQDALKPGDKGSVVAVFRSLQRDSQRRHCPVIVTGPWLATTAPVRQWTMPRLEKRCHANATVDVGNMGRVFTYFDANTAFGDRFKVQPGATDGRIGGYDPVELTAKDFLALVAGPKRRGQHSSHISPSPSLQLPPRSVRFGGKLERSPCPRLKRDAAAYVSPEEGFPSVSLWLGSAGVTSTAHFDMFDNLFCT